MDFKKALKTLKKPKILGFYAALGAALPFVSNFVVDKLGLDFTGSAFVVPAIVLPILAVVLNMFFKQPAQ